MTKKAPDKRVGGSPAVNISDGFGGGSRFRSQKPWHWLTIIHRVAAAVGDNLWDCGVCWGKLGIVLASGEQGDFNLMEIFGAPKYVGKIWSGVGLVGTYHGAGAGDVAAVRKN